jgi:hypothetical protein
VAESIKRLSGPQNISGSTSAPTTLFTVPSKKLYVVREVHMVSAPSTGASNTANPSVLLGLTDLSTGKLVHAQTVQNVLGGYAAETDAMALPFTEGEVLVAAMTGFPTIGRFDYATVNGTTWNNGGGFIFTTTDAASFVAGTYVPQTTVPAPSNVFFPVVNTKATTPDVVSSITDEHRPGVTGIASISTAVNAIVRVSWWGGFLNGVDTVTNTFTVNFGGATQTACFCRPIAFSGAGYAPGAAPSTSNTILQASTNNGTTETVQTVTQTPTAGNVGFQLMIVATSGVNGTYTGGTGSLELQDGAQTVPNVTAACYLFDPPVTNPSATVSGAGTNWAASVIEVARGGYPMTVSTSGVIIEP